MSERALRTAVIGVGYLGRFHAQKHAAVPSIELARVVDIDAQRARQIGAELDVPFCTDYRQIFEEVDAVAIAVPAERHFDIARNCLEAGLHVLLEKPMTETVAEADILVELADRKHRVLQIGHLERFNPVVEAMRAYTVNPLFIEAHRLSAMTNRGTAVDVVLDLMIHDLDIILDLVPGDLVDLSAIGLRVLTEEIDIANARLEFSNGCIANLTASRVSKGAMRKMRMFQPDSYISVDFLHRQLSVSNKEATRDPDSGYPQIESREEALGEADTLLIETEAFVKAISSGTEAPVSGRDGRRALHAAQQITQCMRLAG